MSSEIKVTNENSFSFFDNDKRSFEERQEELDKLNEQEKQIAKRKKNSPFKNFLQVNKETYPLEDKLMKKNPLAYRIWRFLANNMDNYNAIIVSQVTLQEIFESSRTTIYRAIKLLEEENYIRIYKSGTSNVYTLNDQMVWNSWGSNLKYSKFNANVIISETEQTKSNKEEIKLKTQIHKQVEKE